MDFYLLDVKKEVYRLLIYKNQVGKYMQNLTLTCRPIEKQDKLLSVGKIIIYMLEIPMD